MNLRARAYLLGMLPAMLVAGILGGYLSYSRLNDLDAAIKARSESLARSVAQGVEYAVISGDNHHLAEMVRWSVRTRGAAFAAVYKTDGAPITMAGVLPSEFPPPLTAGVLDSEEHITTTIPVMLSPLELSDPFMVPETSVTPQPIAWVRIILSHEEKLAKAREMLLTSLGITLMGLVFAILLARGLAVAGIQPLMDIINAVRRVASGDFRVRLPVTARSELRALQDGINQMGEALQSFREDMRQRIDAATSELDRQKQAAERANQAKSRFLAAASHDLRQPMHAIGLYVAALKPKLSGRAAASIVDKLEASVNAMDSLFNAILDVSRLDAGAVAPRRDRLAVGPLLARLREDFRLQAEAQGLDLRMRAPQAWVMSDPVLLDRILRNLISNALRYTTRGGVMLSARRHGAAMRIQVWDTGIGISPEDQARVFQEFFQVANPQRDRSQGLGLGLAIVDRLARLLGHPISVRSRPGRGTVFSLDVPLAAEQRAGAIRAEPTLDDLTRLKGQVLVVDDDDAVCDALLTLLTGWGLAAVSAGDRAAALSTLTQPPDLLITDYRLADEDGLAVAQALQARWPERDFPVIVITGDTSPRGMLALQASDYPVMHKPVRPARLRALVSRLLNRPHS